MINQNNALTGPSRHWAQLYKHLATSLTLLGLWLLPAPDSQGGEWRAFPYLADSAGIHEPSAVRQLPDGRLLLAQDEASDPFVLVKLDEQGNPVDYTRPRLDSGKSSIWRFGDDGPPRGLEDLEGLALAGDGYLYALTSHSLTLSGKRRKSRERFVRLRLEGDNILDYAVYGKLRKAIRKAYPELNDAFRSAYAKGRRGFNIEGLCATGDGKRLLIGLRGPVSNGDSFILMLENPAAVFEGERPRFAKETIRLDLDKGGIRAMTYHPGLKRYFLVTQKAKKTQSSKRAFRLWSWSGQAAQPAHEVRLPGLELRNTEGITPIRLGKQAYLLLVSDDGDRTRQRPAHYLLLPLGEIHGAPTRH